MTYSGVVSPAPNADASCLIELRECVCGGPVRPLLIGSFLIQGHNGEQVPLSTTLYRCARCDLVTRGVDFTHPQAKSHYDLVNYTDPGNEDEWREKRRIFFDWFCGLVTRSLSRPPRVVMDYGCSYGHLLDRFADAGAETIGVEVAPAMAAHLQRAGRHKVFASVDAAELADESLDAITLIDSLYYHEGDLAAFVATLARKLRPGGVLLTRTTNRNQTYRLYALRWHLRHGRWREGAPIPRRIIGDSRFGFSQRALMPLFQRAGFKRVAAHRWEHKRKTPVERVRDAVALAAYYATAACVDVSPGLVLVMRK